MDELTPIVIDLNKLKGDQIEESFLTMLGYGIERIMRGLFGTSILPVNVRGSSSDVRSFLQTLNAEKRYIQDFKRFGLSDPRTYRSKASVTSAVGKFERSTGIKWPFK